mgnify:CR=1 FL=1
MKPIFRVFWAQNWHLDAMRGPVGSDIQKYQIFSSIFGMDMRTYRVFSSFRGLGDEFQGFVGPLFGPILETFSLPTRIQKSALILRRFLISFWSAFGVIFGLILDVFGERSRFQWICKSKRFVQMRLPQSRFGASQNPSKLMKNRIQK